MYWVTVSLAAANYLLNLECSGKENRLCSSLILQKSESKKVGWFFCLPAANFLQCLNLQTKVLFWIILNSNAWLITRYITLIIYYGEMSNLKCIYTQQHEKFHYYKNHTPTSYNFDKNLMPFQRQENPCYIMGTLLCQIIQ